MALTILKYSSLLNWTQTKALTGFQSATDSGQLPVNVAPTISGAACNRVYFVQATLAAGASVTINLFSLTEPAFGEAIVPVRAYIISFLGAGATWKYEPGAADPLAWFLSGTTPAISGNAGASFSYADATAATISTTAKNIKITNTHGSATLTYTLAVALGV